MGKTDACEDFGVVFFYFNALKGVDRLFIAA